MEMRVRSVNREERGIGFSQICYPFYDDSWVPLNGNFVIDDNGMYVARSTLFKINRSFRDIVLTAGRQPKLAEASAIAPGLISERWLDARLSTKETSQKSILMDRQREREESSPSRTKNTRRAPLLLRCSSTS